MKVVYNSSWTGALHLIVLLMESDGDYIGHSFLAIILSAVCKTTRSVLDTCNILERLFTIDIEGASAQVHCFASGECLDVYKAGATPTFCAPVCGTHILRETGTYCQQLCAIEHTFSTTNMSASTLYKGYS